MAEKLKADGTPRKPSGRPKGSKSKWADQYGAMTPKQRLFADEMLANGMNGSAAARVAYNVTNASSASAVGIVIGRHPVVRDYLIRGMEAASVTPDKGARVLLEALNAVDEKGKPNHTIRLKALDAAVKIWGGYASDHVKLHNAERERERASKEAPGGVLAGEDIRVVRFIAMSGRMPTDAERNMLLGNVVEGQITETKQ